MSLEVSTKIELTEQDLTRIVDSVRRNFGFEFSGYAKPSLKRRVVRYMELKGMEEVDDLCVALRSKEIFNEFLKEVTVNTTELFRDPSVWVRLRDEVIPELLKRKDRIRIWHGACSSGEEVISMCILLNELGVLDRVDVVASDINDDMLLQSKSSLYMGWRIRQYEQNAKQVFPLLELSKYYDIVGSRVQFDMSLIKKVKFKNFDLVLDSCLNSYDIILLRNVLIYFNMELQQEVIYNLKSAITKGGYLVLGAQESIQKKGAMDEFTVFDNTNKIFKV